MPTAPINFAVALLLAPCGNSWIDDAFANYCNVARCLLPMQQYTLETNDNRGEPVLVANTTYHELFLARAGRGAIYVPRTTDPASIEAITTEAWGACGFDYFVVGDDEHLYRKLALEFSGVAQGNPYGTIVQTQSPADAKMWCKHVHRHRAGLGVSCFGWTRDGRVQPLAFDCRFFAHLQ